MLRDVKAAPPTPSGTTWWPCLSLEAGEVAHCQIGPLDLAVQRLAVEWRLRYRYRSSSDEVQCPWKVAETRDHLLEAAEEEVVERFAFSQTSNPLAVFPALADRPIVSRPLAPIHVPVEEQATIFVSVPLWLCIRVGTPPVLIKEVPILKLSDTWFGPSTRQGELCYATRTSARMVQEHLPMLPYRALTRVRIENRSNQTLTVDRLSLPVPYLSLFRDARESLWTEPVTLEHREESGLAMFKIDSELAAGTSRDTRVSTPRQQSEKGVLVRAFSALFG